MNVFSAALLSMCLMCAGSFACGLRRRNLTRSKIMRNFLIFGVTAMVCGLAWAEGQTSSLPNPAHVCWRALKTDPFRGGIRIQN